MYRALIYFITENETGKSSQAVFYMVTSQNVFLSLEMTSCKHFVTAYKSDFNARTF